MFSSLMGKYRLNSFSETPYIWVELDVEITNEEGNGIADFGACSIDNFIYLYGGWAVTSEGQLAFNTVFKFDTSTSISFNEMLLKVILGNNSYIILNDLIDGEIPILDGASMTTVGHKILIVGGADENYVYRNTTYWFDTGK